MSVTAKGLKNLSVSDLATKFVVYLIVFGVCLAIVFQSVSVLLSVYFLLFLGAVTLSSVHGHVAFFHLRTSVNLNPNKYHSNPRPRMVLC